jgi:hypothetical protein
MEAVCLQSVLRVIFSFIVITTVFIFDIGKIKKFQFNDCYYHHQIKRGFSCFMCYQAILITIIISSINRNFSEPNRRKEMFKAPKPEREGESSSGLFRLGTVDTSGIRSNSHDCGWEGVMVLPKST